MLLARENMNMKKFLTYATIVVLSFSIVSCATPKSDTASQLNAPNEIWVFFHFNVPEENGALVPYWYYGRVLSETYQGIVENKITDGSILLKDVRYFDDNDEIVAYEDNIDTGNIVFRIEHIVKMNPAKGDPLSAKE